MTDKTKLIKIILYAILVLSILSGILLIIKTPLKNSLTPLEEGKYELKEFNLPIIQHISINENNLNGIFLNIKDSDIRKIDYQITLTDNSGKIYFNHNFKNSNDNGIIMSFENIENTGNLDLILKISSNNKAQIKIPVLESNKNYIESSNYTLDLSKYHYVKNYGYFWYAIMGILVSITLLLTLERKEK